MPSEIWSILRYRWRVLFDGAALDRELAEELDFHLEEEVDRYERSGLSRDEALRRARDEFGALDEVKEACRRARGPDGVRSGLREIRNAVRRALSSAAAMARQMPAAERPPHGEPRPGSGADARIRRGISSTSTGKIAMQMGAGLQSSRAVGVGCAVAATGLGIGYMAAAGAPRLYLLVNLLALVIGLAFFALLRPDSSPEAGVLPGTVILGGGGALLAATLFGASAEGASRWVRAGGLSVQISLILLPAMLVAFAHRRDFVATLGMIVAVGALALQPDRAMAGMLAAALAVLAVRRRDRCAAWALGFAVSGFLVTLLRPDTLPAVPYVDRILYTAFGVHPLAGFAVVGGALLLAVPALPGLRPGSPSGDASAVFGVAWLGMVAAAAVGNYPTPLVGYGGSAVLGYALSLAFLPGRVPSPAAQPGASDPRPEPRGTDLDLRIAIA